MFTTDACMFVASILINYRPVHTAAKHIGVVKHSVYLLTKTRTVKS